MAETDSSSSREPHAEAFGTSSVAIRCSAGALLAAAVWTTLDLHASLGAVADRSRGPSGGLRVDPIRATAAELELIPGIGPSTAGRIVAHRLRAGGGSLLREDEDGAPRWSLDVVPGIGPITARRAAPYLVPTEGAGERGRPGVRP